MTVALLALVSCAKRGKSPRHSGDSAGVDSGPRDTGDTGQPEDSADSADTGDTGDVAPGPRWSGAVSGTPWWSEAMVGMEVGARVVWSGEGLWAAAPRGGGLVRRLPDGPAVSAAGEAHLGAALAAYADGVLVGAWSRDGGAADEGAVYLLDGSSEDGVVEVELDPIFVVDGGATGLVLWGEGAGDTPDGWLLGRPRMDGDRGHLALVEPVGHTVVAEWTGAAGGELSAGAVTTADLDGDGLRDVAVGAWGASGFSGAVHVALAPFPDHSSWADADRSWTGDTWSLAGFSLASGDVDGDGRPDLVVGAFGDTRNGSGSGAVTVIPSDAPSGPLLALDAHRLGDGPDAHFGAALAVVDADHDGHADLAVGGPDGAEGGVARLFYGPIAGTSGVADAELVVDDGGRGDGLGSAVALHPTLGWAAGAPGLEGGTVFVAAMP